MTDHRNGYTYNGDASGGYGMTKRARELAAEDEARSKLLAERWRAEREVVKAAMPSLRGGPCTRCGKPVGIANRSGICARCRDHGHRAGLRVRGPVARKGP